MRIAGIGGALRYHYQRAAELDEWAIESTRPDIFQVTAKIRRLIAPWCNREPLDLDLYLGENRWTWRHVGAWKVQDQVDALSWQTTVRPDVVKGGK